MSVARHTAYNLAGAVLPVGVTLVTIPLYLQAIGLDRYGVLALAWVLAGYFTFFDFGIGRATARKMATLKNRPADARNRLFWTSAGLTAVLAVMATGLFWPIASFALSRMNISAALRPELRDALPFLIAAVPIGVVQSLLTGALEGRRAFGPLNIIQIGGAILTAILPLISAWTFGPRLSYLIAATLAGRLLVLTMQLVVCRRIVPLAAPKRERDKSVKELLTFGSWTTVSGIAGPLLVYFDRFAIGAFLGASAVGFYVIGYNVISQLQVVPSALSRALFPRLAELSPDESARRTMDGVRAMTALVTPIAIVSIFATQPFLRLWLGSNVSTVTGPVTVILLVGVWSNALASVAFARLHAIGRPDAPARLHLAELLPYGAALYGGMYLWGLSGAAMAWSARCTVDLTGLALLARLSRELTGSLSFGFVLVLISTFMALGIRDPLLYPLALVYITIALLWSWAILPRNLKSALIAAARRPFTSLRVSR